MGVSALVKIIIGENDLFTTNPELIGEWDYDKNTISPTSVTAGSQKRVWWICQEHKHSWQAIIKNRAKGIGCPYCSGRNATMGTNDLATLFPELATEWDYEKNDGLTPYNVPTGSNKKVWWKCKTYNHSWQAFIQNRTKHNQGCPYCSGRRALFGFNDLTTTDPDIAAEWAYENNNDLKPTEVTRGSNKKVWWRCKEGHKWESTVNSRTAGHGCPYCSGQRAVKGINDLSTTNPELLAEWDYKKNKDIDINTVMHGSHQKAWWKCKECGYEWQASISNRAKGKGCPLCSNLVTVTGINDLATKCPDLLQEWDSEKNTNIQPETVYFMSTLKAWWKCKKCGRSWQSIIRNRSEKGVGCAVCSGKACGTGINDLETLFPWLIEEFDTHKNRIKPNEIAAHSGTKVWWKCSSCGKSWQTAVSNRTGNNQTGCPYCNSEKHTSFPEQALFFYICKYYSDAINSYIIQGCKELDIFIPSLKTAIEYDGVIWHTDIEKDERKNKDCIERGIKLIRIRENGLPKLKANCIEYSVIPNDRNDLERVIIDILSKELNVSPDSININLSRDITQIQAKYRTLKNEKSLSSMYPEIAEEWCYERNGDLLPDKVTVGSGIRVWWKCKSCGFEWETAIYHRTHNTTGCPRCQKKNAHEKFMAQMLEKAVTL